MTIANAWVEDDRVLFGCDSWALHPDGRGQLTTKAWPLFHVPAVIMGRGEMPVIWGAVGGLMQCEHQTLDQIADAIPAAAHSVIGHISAMMPPEADYQNAGVEIAIAGWSQASQKMRGFYFTKFPGAADFKREEMSPHYVSVWHEEIPFDLNPDSPENMKRLAIRQHELLARFEGPEVAGHGPFYMGVLTRDGIQIRKLFDL